MGEFRPIGSDSSSTKLGREEIRRPQIVFSVRTTNSHWTLPTPLEVSKKLLIYKSRTWGMKS